LSSAAQSKAALYSSSYKYKGRILLVDDIAQSFFLAFQKNGFIVDTYNDPIKALSNFKTDLYDIVLIDIRLPNMDGFAL
jgi:DNA-binding response OmpR family regulator